MCTVYEARFEKCSECIDIEEAIIRHALPGDCPYVQGLHGYNGPRSYHLLVLRYGSDILSRLTGENDA